MNESFQPFAVKRLSALRRAPRMFAYTREAFAAQVTTLLDLLGVEHKAVSAFMIRTFGVPHTCAADTAKLCTEVDDTWAQALVDEAMALAGLE